MKHIELVGTELYDEIKAFLFEEEIGHTIRAWENISSTEPTQKKLCQNKKNCKGIPADIEVDINRGVSDNLVC